jgi:hypothetical protein
VKDILKTLAAVLMSLTLLFIVILIKIIFDSSLAMVGLFTLPAVIGIIVFLLALDALVLARLKEPKNKQKYLKLP